MADQTPPEVEAPNAAVDTPTVEDGTGTQQQATNWQERYENLHPEFTRTTQELSQYRQVVDALTSEDPDTRLQAAQLLGLELASPEIDPDAFVDPNDELRQQLQDLTQWRDQLTQGAQQQAQEQRDIDHIGAGLAQISQELGRDLTDEEQQLLGDSAWTNRDEQGLPNIDIVGKAYLQVINGTVLPRYRKTKPKAPVVAPTGGPGTLTPDRASESESDRWDRMTQRMADLSDDQ